MIIVDLLSDNEDKSEIEPKIKIYDNYYNQNQNNNILELLKEIINENINEENYFSQNKSFSTMNISSKFINNDIPKINNFPNILELEKLSSKVFDKNDNSMEEIILYVRTLLTPLFRKILPPNAISGKIPCSSGGSLSIQGIKKWICSGFTYSYIFEKQGGKKKYIIFLLLLIFLNQLFYYVIIPIQ